tara:strand:- start:294 stop:509 length:216 start_codon:yes stop_codon:yes gene_type:complete
MSWKEIIKSEGKKQLISRLRETIKDGKEFLYGPVFDRAMKNLDAMEESMNDDSKFDRLLDEVKEVIMLNEL